MNKRTISIMLSILLLFSLALTGCKSKAERAYEESIQAARAAEADAQKAQKEYNDLVDSLDHLNSLYDKIK